MAAVEHEEIAQPSFAFISAIAGEDTHLHPSEDAFAFARKELDAIRLREQDDAAQIVELNLIRKLADDIEDDYKKRDLALPTVFILYSAGVDVPSDIVQQFIYGTEPIEQLPKADIAGHLGVAGAIKLNEKHTAMVFNGRAHPFSGVGKRYAEMVYARQLNTVKELMRRQRERGIQSAVITTYLTGVDETSPLKKGDLGVVIDHTELAGGRAALSAGSGPRNYLDRFIGEQFESKLGRSSDSLLTQLFSKLSSARGIIVGPAGALGTPGTTSYQGALDRGVGLSAFESAKVKLNEIAERIFGTPLDTSLFFDMSLSFEIDVLRQVILRKQLVGIEEYTEEDFPAIFVVIPTDVVGAESEKIDHAQVVAEARRQGKRNGDLIREFATSLSTQLDSMHPVSTPPSWVDNRFSLDALLPK